LLQRIRAVREAWATGEKKGKTQQMRLPTMLERIAVPAEN